MTDHEPSYKRQTDMLIKVMVVISPLLSAAFAWGITQGQLSAVRESISEIKGWIKAHQEFTIQSVRETGRMSSDISNVDRTITDIKLMMEKRFK
jgi:hypothetical protein